MSVITPQTNVKLLKVPFTIDNENQLTFSNATAQYTYFNSLPKLEYDKFTYQRKNNYIAVNEDADTLQAYNYCMYQNKQYGNKWFYAYITNITYEGNEVSYVYIKLDPFQTWQFDLTFKRSFVEREHTNDDTLGNNTVPENLETGEYIVNGKSSYDIQGTYNENIIVLASTIAPTLDSGGVLIGTNNGGGIYGGIKTGFRYYSYRINGAKLPNVIDAFADAGKTDAIVALFMLPASFITSDPNLDLDGYDIPNDNIGRQFTWSITGLTTVNSYVPVNNKVLVYPYRYLYVTNNNGGNAIFHYEKFTTPTSLSFEVNETITPAGSCVAYPVNYNGVSKNYSEMLACAKFPICGFQNDVYKNWLTQNGLNLSSKLIGGAAMMIGGVAAAATGLGIVAGGASALGGLGTVYSTLQSINQQKNFTPPQAEGNVSTADVNFSRGLNTFDCYQMSVRSEYAKIIDNFFSKYGYKTNRVKVPNITGRTNWNYVKTIGCNITANIPQNDLQEIKDMFDKGITLWHNSSTFLDYSQSNTIVS